MRSRVVVALVGVPIVYVLTVLEYAGNLTFALLITLVSVVALAEFYTMMRRHGPYVPAGLIVAIVMPLLTWRAYEPGLLAGLMLLLPLTLIFYSLSVQRRDPIGAVAVTYMGVAYVVVGASLVLELRLGPHGLDLIFLLLAGTWMTDTGAFLVGKAIGRHKLAPRLSPNKTIEGLVGGLALGITTLWFGHYMVPDDWLSGTDAVLLGVLVATATVVGDLFESLLKRAAGVKDSGRLLGEHGGMLDRVDALLLSGPTMYIGAFIIGAT